MCNAITIWTSNVLLDCLVKKYCYLCFSGMANVLPNHRPYWPRLGKKVLINVGKPINITSILSTLDEKKAAVKRKIITDYIQEEMEILRRDTLILAKQEGLNPESNSHTNNNSGVF